MRLREFFVLPTLLAALGLGLLAQQQDGLAGIPRTWDDAAIANHGVPLADAAASPRHVTADYYYHIPVRPIYQSYPVYAPGHKPAGYLEWLKQQEPVILWDDRGQAPPLQPTPTGFGPERWSSTLRRGEIDSSASTMSGTLSGMRRQVCVSRRTASCRPSSTSSKRRESWSSAFWAAPAVTPG